MASTHSSFPHIDHRDLPSLQTSSIHLAAYNGDVTRVRERLSEGDDVDALCSDLVDGKMGVFTPLFCAAVRGHGKVARVLLQAGANPSLVVDSTDGTSTDGTTTSVLFVAAASGHLEVVTMLIKAGAVVDWTDHEEKTAIHAAAYAGHDSVVEALLSAKATVDMANYGGYTPLMTASRYGHEKCVRLLLYAGADLRKITNSGQTALHSGARGGSVAVVELLLSRGADVSSTGKTSASDEVRLSALHVASQHGNIGVIKALLNAGAGIGWTDELGRTALHYAALFDRAHVVESLLATLDTKDLKGATALFLAALDGKEDVAKALLSWGASVDTADFVGTTALFAAANQGHPQIMKLLLDAGADHRIRDHEYATALMRAKDLPTAKMLMEAGASATDVDIDGYTVLHHMGMRGCSSGAICSVFRAGANPTLLNKMGLTATQVARAYGHNDSATLLDMLATKYTQTENSVVESAESSQAIEEEQQKQKVLRPCVNCQTLTHRRCARCRTAYMCSHDCQVATLAEHRVECLQIYEERKLARAERKAAKGQEKSC